MYSVNGINLDDEDRGWRVLRKGTQAIFGITKRLTSVVVPGYDGVFKAPSTRSEQPLIFQVLSKRENVEELLALLDRPTLIVTKNDDPTRSAAGELVSAIPSGEFPFDDLVYITVTININGGAWRSVTSTITGPITITDPVQQITLLDGISAPIRDMDVFIGGVIGQFQLVDSQGSWLKSTQAWVPNTSGTGMLYVGATGQTFVANVANPWTPVSDAGHLVDVSGGGGFKMTPELVSGDPAVRRAHLTLTTLTQTSATIRVRAKNAYSMQYGG